MRSVSLCLLLIVSLVIFGCAAKNTATVPETDNAPVAQTVTLEVDGIKCGCLLYTSPSPRDRG